MSHLLCEMESLSREWQRFSLTGKERVKINLNSSFFQPKFIIIAALVTMSGDFTVYGNIIQDTKDDTGSLTWFSFSHVNQKANGVAHLLARKAKDVQESITWTHTMPPDVHSVILKDLQ